MAEYLSDDQQVEALKSWWKENGKSIIGGIVLGLLIVGGWQGWRRYTNSQAELASTYFEQLQQTVQREDVQTARREGERLLGEFGTTTYAVLTAMALARLAYDAGDINEAETRLRWAMSQAADKALEQLTRLRLVRVLVDQGKLDEALDLSGRPVGEAFAGEFLALRGDIALAKGDKDGARQAYQEALKKGVEDRALLTMKLAELGAESPAG